MTDHIFILHKNDAPGASSSNKSPDDPIEHTTDIVEVYVTGGHNCSEQIEQFQASLWAAI